MRNLTRKILFPLYLYIIYSSFSSCDMIPRPVASKPDLTFEDELKILNTCTGRYEIIKPSRFFTVLNLGYPYNGFPQFVYLYLNDYNYLHDCFGNPWSLANGTTLTSSRRLINKKDGFKKTEKARQGVISRYVTITNPNGSTDTNHLPSVVFNDIEPNSIKELESRITVINGSLITLNHEIDVSKEIDERDEYNNSDMTSIQSARLHISTIDNYIKFYSETELKKLNKPYIRYSEGTIYKVK